MEVNFEDPKFLSALNEGRISLMAGPRFAEVHKVYPQYGRVYGAILHDVVSMVPVACVWDMRGKNFNIDGSHLTAVPATVLKPLYLALRRVATGAEWVSVHTVLPVRDKNMVALKKVSATFTIGEFCTEGA